MLVTVLLIIVGFILLASSADFLLKGAMNIAKHLRVSHFFISMTVVSFGTSIPELLISLQSNFQGEGDFIVSNIVGSNISNILLVLGFTAIFRKVHIDSKILFQDIPFSIFISILLGLMVNLHLIAVGTHNQYIVDRIEGVILIVILSIFIKRLWTRSKKQLLLESKLSFQPSVNIEKKLSPIKSLVYILIGSVGLYFGGQLVINKCIFLVELYDLGKGFVGLSIIALGTSLPELVTSIYAVINRKEDMAVGNVIGSNICNILWVLGITCIFSPIKYFDSLNTDIAILIGLNIILGIIIYSFKNFVNRISGVSLVLGYIVYLYFTYTRLLV